ncbi:MAG TPA: hypothetical protein VGE13_01135, partial [Candidatus Saccharimonadales bacterium]
MSSLSERLAVARREAAAQSAEARSEQESTPDSADAPDWDSLADMARNLQDRLDQAGLEDPSEESDPEQGDPESDPLPSSDTSENEPEDSENDAEDIPEDQETERESRIDRARAAGAAALESAGVIALGQLTKITDRMQARDDRKQEAQEDYDNALDRPLDQLITDDKEILGDHASSLFRDRARRKADNLVEKISQA